MKRKCPIRLIPLAWSILLGGCVPLGDGPAFDTAGSLTAAVNTVAATLTAAVPTATPTLTPTIPPTAAPPTNTPTRIPTRPQATAVSLCDNSAYVSDVTIPDGTVVEAGQAFSKTWRLKNIGTCGWTTAYSIGFVNGNRMDGVTTPMPQAVAPGDTVDITVELAAPTTAGTYVGNWMLRNEKETFFGVLVYVQIVVSGGTPSGVTPAAPTAT